MSESEFTNPNSTMQPQVYWSQFWTGPESVRHLHSNRSMFTILGIALITVGVIAMIYVGVATLASVVIVGVMLAAAGASQVAHVIYTQRWSGFFANLVIGLFATITGLLLILRPDAGAVSITLLLASFFLMAGAVRMVSAAILRFPGWGWFALSGGIAAFLGLMIAGQWPTSSVWVIGTFIGMDLIFAGWSFLMFANALRDEQYGHHPGGAVLG